MSEKKESLEDELEKELLGGGDDDFDFEAAEMRDTTTEDEIAESLSLQLEGEMERKSYKYLELSIKQSSANEYDIIIKHQSHGFLNYLTSKLLQSKGVEFAAYKKSSIDVPKIYVRTKNDRDIKAIFQEAIKFARTEWKGMRNAIEATKM
jgi:DNA-directed RNA polymerase subunit L